MALMAWSMPPDMVPMYSSHTRPPSPSSARVMEVDHSYARATASKEATCDRGNVGARGEGVRKREMARGVHGDVSTCRVLREP